MKTITILGGYGVFGSRIAEALATTDGFRVRIAGRDAERGKKSALRNGTEFVPCRLPDPASLRDCVSGSDLVIHTAGPFQAKDYLVARTCLNLGIHYLDIADARAFVCGITDLDAQARDLRLSIISGASSAPTITGALVAELRGEFRSIHRIQAALSPGNQNPRGASTIGAILSYLGRPIRIWEDGRWIDRPGWGDRQRLEFPPHVGLRDVYNCEVPDLALFPERFGAAGVRFSAGLELRFLNRVLTALAGFRRCVKWRGLPGWAPLFLRVSLWFFGQGSQHGSLAVWMRGTSREGRQMERKIAIVTAEDGPATPSCPAILLTRKLFLGKGLPVGAYPGVGHLTLSEILPHLEPLGIWCARGDSDGRWSLPPSGIGGSRT